MKNQNVLHEFVIDHKNNKIYDRNKYLRLPLIFKQTEKKYIARDIELINTF